MNSLVGRFNTFILKEKTRDFFAFVFYVLNIIFAIEIDLPQVLEKICFSLLMFISIIGCTVYLPEWMDKTFLRIDGQLIKNIRQELRKIFREIILFIPVLIITICITSLIIVGQPANQTSVEEFFKENSIVSLILAIVIGPIIEEFIFRFLPYRFIKNRILYVILSTVIFAALHVIDDPNPFYYVWFYMMRPFYYSYRYHKTQDIWVAISMHSLNNLVATILFIFK